MSPKNENIIIGEAELFEINRIVDIARLYYIEALDQREIAEKRRISQSEVSRLLKAARDRNIITFSVSPVYSENLSAALRKRFPHLDDVIISYLTYTDNEKDLLQIMGYEGAKYFFNNVDHAYSIGLSCGRTLNALVSSINEVGKHLQATLPEKCKIYALSNPCIEEIVDITPASLVASMVRRLPRSIGYAYQFPPLAEGLERCCTIEEYKKNPRIIAMLNRMKKLDVYFVGIGYVSLDKEKFVGPGLQFNSLVSSLNLTDTLKDLGAVGECDHQPFDRSGNFLIERPELHNLRSQLLILPLEVLQGHVRDSSARVVAVAGGGMKHEAIYAALKAKIFNVLITDSLTALKLKEFSDKKK